MFMLCSGVLLFLYLITTWTGYLWVVFTVEELPGLTEHPVCFRMCK